MKCKLTMEVNWLPSTNSHMKLPLHLAHNHFHKWHIITVNTFDGTVIYFPRLDKSRHRNSLINEANRLGTVIKLLSFIENG